MDSLAPAQRIQQIQPAVWRLQVDCLAIRSRNPRDCLGHKRRLHLLRLPAVVCLETPTLRLNPQQALDSLETLPLMLLLHNNNQPLAEACLAHQRPRSQPEDYSGHLPQRRPSNQVQELACLANLPHRTSLLSKRAAYSVQAQLQTHNLQLVVSLVNRKQSLRDLSCKLTHDLNKPIRQVDTMLSSRSGQAQPQQNTAPTLGQSTNAVSAVQINWDSIRPRTRFDDLAKPVQDEIALLDKGIQRVIKMKDEIGEFMPQHERDIEQLARDVKFVESKFKVVQVALNNDIQTVKVLQDMTKKNIADAQLSFKATDNLKLPTHYHQTGLFASTSPSNDSTSADAASTHANAQDLITYFNRKCDDIEKYKKRLDDYRSDIERDMPGVENGLYEQIRALRERGSGSVVVQDKLGEVLAALRDTGNAIIAQAGQIAEVRERLSRLQAGILDSGAYAPNMAI